MNLKPFLKRDNNSFTVILQNSVQNYGPFPFLHVDTRVAWSGSDVREILELEHGFDHNNDPILKRIHDQFLINVIMPDNHYLADFDKEPDADLWQITFFHNDHSESWNDFISKYLQHFGNTILDLWKNRGADDDYFDYLPSVTDTFYQLCKLLEAKEDWEIFLASLLFIESELSDESDPREDSLYRFKF